MPSRDRPEEIAITHEMIEAGVTAFFEWDGRVEEPSGLVVQVFEAMIARVSTSFARQPYPQSDSGVVFGNRSEIQRRECRDGEKTCAA